MKKKLYHIGSVALMLALILPMVACGAKTSPSGSGDPDTIGDVQEPIKISVGTTNVDGDPMQELVYYFEEQVDSILPGRIEWVNHINSSLGSERELGEMVLDNSLDASLQGVSNLTAIAPLKAVRLQDIPFLFKDQDELYDATDEWYRDMINAECEPYGFTTIFYEYIMGQEIENTRRPVTTPEDLKGLKIRIYDSPGPYYFVEACGGIATPMSFSEVYTSLQQGAIDGTYTTTSSFVADGLCGVTKYHTKMSVTNLGMTLIWNSAALESYPEDVQDALAEAAKRTEQYCRETLGPETRESIYSEIESLGVEVNEVPEEDYARFVQLVEDYCYDKMKEEIGADIWDQCVEWINEYRAR